MKRIMSIMFLILCLSFIVNVNAECDYKKQVDLASDAANINIKYEVATKTIQDPEMLCDGDEDGICKMDIDYFIIHILNLNENFTLTISNDFNNEKKYFNSSDVDENGIISFEWMNVSSVTNFTFNVYSSDITECGNKHLRTVYFTTPRKNEYYDYDMCDGHEDLYVCEKFVTNDEISFNEFTKTIEDAEKSDNPKKEKLSFFQEIIKFIKENKGIVIGCGAGVIIITVTVIVIIRKKNNIWK